MSKYTLTLSIVIPAYNEERYIGGCLDAIAAQAQAPNEVIVVDNNSSDKTVEIVKNYPFVKLIRERRQGIVFARNRGFNEAKSDIIGRVDADSHLAADWVEKTLRSFSQKTEVAALTGDCYFYDFPAQKSFHYLHKFTFYIVQRWIAGTHILWGSNMAIRRSVWREVKSMASTEKSIHEDIDLSLKLKSKNLKIAHVNTMRAEVSLRRGDLGIRSLNRYLSAWHHTYVINGLYIRGLFIFVLEALTLIAAVIAWPFTHSRK